MEESQDTKKIPEFRLDQWLIESGNVNISTKDLFCFKFSGSDPAECKEVALRNYELCKNMIENPDVQMADHWNALLAEWAPLAEKWQNHRRNK